MASRLLLGVDQPAEWKAWLARAKCTDVYFTPEYAQIWAGIEGGTSHLFVFEDRETVFIYPIRLRSIAEIQGLSDFSGWYDITSDYGYGGPYVVFEKGAPLQSGFIQKALSAFEETCKDHHVIAEFCRFHPLLQNHQLVENQYKPIFCNKTAWIDLILSPEEIWRQIRKGHRYDLRKAEKSGLEIERTSAVEDSSICYQLYLKTMQDVGASSYYYFNSDLFEMTMSLLSEHAIIFLAKYQGKMIAASMFIYGDEFFHYHFSGFDREFSGITPNKLMLYQATSWAKDKGFSKFHLGGGQGGKDKDSLMLFKSGFTKLRSDFYVAKRIHQEEIYAQACKSVGVDPQAELFFPAYRAQCRG